MAPMSSADSNPQRKRVDTRVKPKDFTGEESEGITVRHQVYSWINVEAGQDVSALSPEEVCEKHGVPEDVFAGHLDKELKSEQDVLSLPWAVLSLVLFALMLLQHEQMSFVHAIEHGIADDIVENANFAFTGEFGGKDYRDVNSFADFWSWMNKGFMPLANADTMAVSEESALDRGEIDHHGTTGPPFLWHHTKMTPIKISQERARDAECPNKEIAAAFGMACTENPNVDMQIVPTKWGLVEKPYGEDTSKTVWFNKRMNESHIALRNLETKDWLDSKTSRVKVSLLTFHADTDLAVLTSVNFLFARSGRIWKVVTHESMKLTPYAGFFDYIWDILFILQVTFVCFQELVEIVRHLRHDHGVWSGLKNYMGIWNAVDWVYILTGYMYLILWLTRVGKLSAVGDDFHNFPAEAYACTDDCGTTFANCLGHAEDAGRFAANTRVFGAIVPLVLLLRLFKAFSAQPRLAVLTETLRLAFSDLVHYLIVFSTVFFAYAVLAVALFGREVEEFATLDRAVPATFNLLMGNFEYERLQVVGRAYAFMVFLSFNLLMVLVMMSMLIAIIMDVYVVVKAHSGKSETIWSEAWDITRRAYMNQRKARLPLNKIRSHFDADSEEKLFLKDVVDRVPHLQTKQAARLLVDSAARWQNEHELHVQVGVVKNWVDKASEFLVDMAEGDFSFSDPVPSYSSGVSTSFSQQHSVDDLLAAAAKKLESNPSAWFMAGKGMSKLMVCARAASKDISISKDVAASRGIIHA